MNLSNKQFTVFQSNGWAVKFNLVQDATNYITGRDADASGPAGASLDGDIESGTVLGDQFIVVVAWNGNGRGQYNGRVGIDGKLSGVTFDLENPTIQATWVCPELVAV
jgi:hypothetical protein